MRNTIIVPAKELKAGDLLVERGRVFRITAVETITVDNQGETWDAFDTTIITFAHRQSHQTPPNVGFRIKERDV